MTKVNTISTCLIVKNEEDTLERCLNSVKDFTDEIVIVDTGSTDKTKEIAEKFNCNIYDFQWINDFGAARNFAFSKATKDYILWVDADDYITNDNIEKIKAIKEKLNPSIDGVSMHYSLSRDDKGNTTYSLRRNRIVKRSKNFKWIGKIHEYLEVSGNILHEEISIHHGKNKPHTNRNLTIFRSMQEKNDEFSPRDTFYFANELYYNELYEEAIEQYEKFIDSGLGWVEDVKTATSNLIICYTFTNKKEKRKKAILKTFEIDTPRADLCCRLGEYFLEDNLVKQSIFWYKVALGCKTEKGNLGIDHKDYYTWIPAIQLCVCYSRLGDYDTAYYYNELTALYVPNSPKVAHNRNFLTDKFKELNKEAPEIEKTLFLKNYRYL